MSSMYGYVRVSSKDQNEERQIIAMTEFGIEESHIIVEKQSGKDFQRPKYKTLIKKLQKDDILVIKSIDRLGRSYEEIIEQWRYITKVKKAAFVVLDMPLLDTRQDKDLVGTLIADLVLQLLSYVAQTEREFIHQRQKEGISAAKARGVTFGRPPMKRPETYLYYKDLWRDGTITASEAARGLNVNRMTFVRWVAKDQSVESECDMSETGEL